MYTYLVLHFKTFSDQRTNRNKYTSILSAMFSFFNLSREIITSRVVVGNNTIFRILYDCSDFWERDRERVSSALFTGEIYGGYFAVVNLSFAERFLLWYQGKMSKRRLDVDGNSSNSVSTAKRIREELRWASGICKGWKWQLLKSAGKVKVFAWITAFAIR